mgnify:CR=1 FL=1
METRYAPREIEKVVAKMFTFAPRQLRWLEDMSAKTGLSRSQILRIAIDAAIRGEIADVESERAA